jgi:hypothetical protein
MLLSDDDVLTWTWAWRPSAIRLPVPEPLPVPQPEPAVLAPEHKCLEPPTMIVSAEPEPEPQCSTPGPSPRPSVSPRRSDSSSPPAFEGIRPWLRHLQQEDLAALDALLNARHVEALAPMEKRAEPNWGPLRTGPGGRRLTDRAGASGWARAALVLVGGGTAAWIFLRPSLTGTTPAPPASSTRHHGARGHRRRSRQRCHRDRPSLERSRQRALHADHDHATRGRTDADGASRRCRQQRPGERRARGRPRGVPPRRLPRLGPQLRGQPARGPGQPHRADPRGLLRRDAAEGPAERAGARALHRAGLLPGPQLLSVAVGPFRQRVAGVASRVRPTSRTARSQGRRLRLDL